MSPRIEEAKPWNELNTDQSPNRGAYRFGTAAGVVGLAAKVCGPDQNRRADVAKSLMRLVDATQIDLRSDGRVARNDRTHAVASRLVRTAVNISFYAEGPIGDRDLQEWAFDIALLVADLVSEAIALDDSTPLAGGLTSKIEARVARLTPTTDTDTDSDGVDAVAVDAA